MAFVWVLLSRGISALTNRSLTRSLCRMACVVFGIAFISLGLFSTPAAIADLNDDNFDGNIFALYAGNGSIVPPRVTLKTSLEQGKPAVLVFYVDDSRDCKQFSPVISRLEGFYGRAASFIPIMADALPTQRSADPTNPSHYFQGLVPQTLIFNQAGDVVFNEAGNVAFEKMDDVLREVFDLLPRSESVELKRRVVNEINTELVEEAS